MDKYKEPQFTIEIIDFVSWCEKNGKDMRNPNSLKEYLKEVNK